MAKNKFTRGLTAGITALVLSSLFFGLVSPILPDATAQAPREGTWAAQTSGTSRRLSSVFFYDANNGWIVGDGGTFIRTTNGGASWTVMDSGILNNLRGIFFLSAQDGWVAGDSGYVARTSDGGITWNKLETGTSSALLTIKFKDINTGWVVGDNGVIMETTNGGASWTRKVSGTNHLLRSLIFADALTYWITGDSGTFVRTEDGGLNWLTQPAIASQANLESVNFPLPGNGWAVGASGVALTSADGGKNWTRIILPTANNFHSIVFIDVNNGWIAADNGTLVVTKDGGKTWDLRFLGISARLNALFFTSSKNGWVVGDTGVLFKYTLVETLGPTDTSLGQDLSEDGRVVMSLRIDRVKDPATGQPRQAARGIIGVKVTLNYEEGFAVQDFKGIAPFDKADIKVNNVSGVASFEVLQREVEAQPSLAIGSFYPRLAGSSAKKTTVTANFTSIVEGSGNEIPQSAPLSLALRRGDAKADGVIDVNDTTIIARLLATRARKDELNLLNAASVYPDGPTGDKVTIKDAMYLAQKIAGVRNDEFQPANVFWADALAS